MAEETVKLYKEPNKFAEKPALELNTLSVVEGYQKYFISQNHIEVNPDDKKLLIKKDLTFNLFNTSWFNNKTVLDIGANGGFFSFYALLKGAKNVSSIDIDQDYINIIKQIKDYYHFQNIEIISDNLLNYNNPKDLVFAFALIHWIYSCTADYGNLDKAVGKLADLTNDILIVEWIEPRDDAINFFKHIEFNKQIISGDYTRELFEEALKKYFLAFKKIAKISDTRDVYIAIKRNEIIEQLNESNSNINLWELFAILNEKLISYTILKNKEIITDNFEKYDDFQIDILIDNNGIDLFNSFLASYKHYSDDKIIIYKMPISLSQANRKLSIKFIIQGSGYIDKAFEKRIVQSRIKFKSIYCLKNQDEQLYIYYLLIYHLGAVSNTYLKVFGSEITNFNPLTEKLKENDIIQSDNNQNLQDFTLEYLYSPDKVIYSRILDVINDKYYISRIYKIDNKIIKQASSEIGKREFRFLLKFDSNYFPKVVNPIEAKNYFAFEMEFIEGFLLSDLQKFFNENDKNNYLKFVDSLLDILAELSDKNIIHRDILKENIIVRNNKPVLIDFGWAIEKNEDFITPTGLGKGKLPSDKIHCDVYSMGLIIAELDENYNLLQDLIISMTENNSEKRIKDISKLREILHNELENIESDLVSIIIPAHNNLDLTKNCIESIYKYTNKENFEIIAVDNASEDGTSEFFKYSANQNPNFTYIYNEKNLSFSKTNNLAIQQAKGNYVLLLNNDTEVSENWLEPLLYEVKKENASIVGALLLYPNSNKIQHCGVKLGIFDGKKMFYHIHRLRKLEYVEDAEQSKDIDFVSAACMLIDKNIFDEIGYFDEKFVNGFEDIDFCIRAKQKELNIRYTGKCKIYHHESQTEGRNKFDEENYNRLIEKWNDVLIPSETEQNSVINLMDMWLREDLIKEPDNYDKIKELINIAKIRNNPKEIAELESLMNNQQIEDSKISIIIPVFNNLDYTEKCINSIYRYTFTDFELIIVDNNSTDGTRDYLNTLSNENDEVKVITNTSNLGFAKASNQGAMQSSGKYLLFLNNDTEVQSGWLDALLQRINSDKNIGVVGSKLIYPDNTIQHCGIEFQREKGSYILWPQHRYRHIDKNAPEANEVEEVDAITGACLMISKDIFNFVGSFDESYQMYFEDTDLCFKVRKAGYKIVYEPKSEVIHYESRTIKNQDVINELNIESAKIFYRKWAKEIALLELNSYIEKEDDNFVYLSNEIFPNLDDKNSLEHFYSFFLMLPSFYLHVGGIGDALLLLSTFYDDNPEQIIFSLTRNPNGMRNFFSEFKKLKKVYFFNWDGNIQIELFLRGIFPKMNNFLGMGATPEHWNNELEWNSFLNIFDKYHIKNKPDWAKKYIGEKITNPQIVLSPTGSLKGMPQWKRNWIKPEYWDKILKFLNEQNIKPIVIGTKEENRDFPINSNCIDKRSNFFKEQMSIIASADICIAADSWHKTFAALVGTPTIVFQSDRDDNAINIQDSSEYVFIYPWEELSLVKNYDEFIKEFNKSRGIPQKTTSKPIRKTSFSKEFWRNTYDKIKTVLIKCPKAVGDALTSTALVADLKKQYPHLIISVSGDKNAEDIFKGHKDVQGFFLTDTEEEFAVEQISDKVVDYNIIISKMPEYYNKIEYMDIIGNLAGLKFENRDIIYQFNDDEKNYATQELDNFKNSTIIGLHLITDKDIKRCYPYGEDLIKELLNLDNNLRFVLFGKEKLKEKIYQVYDCADLNVDLRNQIALASKCDAFLTIDSAFFHIGHNLFDKPTMVLCGATNPKLIGNQNKEFYYLRNEDLDCLNCYWQKKCSIECMYNLKPEFIAKEFYKIISNFVKK